MMTQREKLAFQEAVNKVFEAHSNRTDKLEVRLDKLEENMEAFAAILTPAQRKKLGLEDALSEEDSE